MTVVGTVQLGHWPTTLWLLLQPRPRSPTRSTPPSTRNSSWQQALPPRASFLAVPLANAAKGYVQQAVTRVLQSPQFRALWRQSTTFTHAEVIKVLLGKSNGAVTTSKGQVVLNLVPVLNSALQSIEPYVTGVVGNPVKLPTISGNELPATACEKIANAVGRPIPATCGQIPLFPADKLTKVQRLARIFNRSVVLLLILTPVVAAIAIWVSRRRRRTIMQLAVGGILGLVIIRRVIIYVQGTLASSVKPANKAAVQDILKQVFRNYFGVSRWLLIALLVVVVVAAAHRTIRLGQSLPPPGRSGRGGNP